MNSGVLQLEGTGETGQICLAWILAGVPVSHSCTSSGVFCSVDAGHATQASESLSISILSPIPQQPLAGAPADDVDT